MRGLPRSPIRSFSAAAHKAVGWALYRVGAHEGARRHYERVLELRGDDFGAYVHLALCAYKLGDYASWQRECGHARRTSPARYARLKHPFELFDPRGADGDTREVPRIPWRRPFQVSRAGSAADPARSGADATPPSRPREVVRDVCDDFTSEAERARFRAFGAIAPEDVRAADLDDLSRRLGS